MSDVTNSTPHYSEDFIDNDEGWWEAKCACGWSSGPYPSAEDACDALMDHAYLSGYSAGLASNESWKDTP